MTELKPGLIVLIVAFDDVPEHRFQIQSIEEDCVTGIALDGPLAGQYGEPSISMIKFIYPN